MISGFYSNSNILNIPRDLYKKEGSNNIFRASSLLLGSNYQTSFKKSINNYESNRVSNFVSFFNNSLKSINSLSNKLSDRNTINLSDEKAPGITSTFDENNDYFKLSNNAYSIVSNFKNFIDDINYFLDALKQYSSKKNDSLSILNKQIENDLIENKEELSYFGISLDENNRLEFNEEELIDNLKEPDRLSEIASKDDSIFNKIASRTERALDDSISKYLPKENNDKKSDPILFNYLANSEKAPLNNAVTSGNVIDYTF